MLHGRISWEQTSSDQSARLCVVSVLSYYSFLKDQGEDEDCIICSFILFILGKRIRSNDEASEYEKKEQERKKRLEMHKLAIID